MAETALTKTTLTGKWSDTGVAVTMAAVDNVNGNSFAAAVDAMVIVHNTAGVAKTFQLTSQPLSPSNRSGDVSQSLAAGEIRVFRVTKDGWQDANGNVLLPTGLDAALEVGIVEWE